MLCLSLMCPWSFLIPTFATIIIPSEGTFTSRITFRIVSQVIFCFCKIIVLLFFFNVYPVVMYRCWPCVFALIYQAGWEGLVCLPWSTSAGQRACVFALIHQLRPEDLVCLIHQPRPEGLVCWPWSTSPGQRTLYVCPQGFYGTG